MNICHGYVYRHAQLECHSLNIVWDITIIIIIVRDAIVFLSEHWYRCLDKFRLKTKFLFCLLQPVSGLLWSLPTMSTRVHTYVGGSRTRTYFWRHLLMMRIDYVFLLVTKARSESTHWPDCVCLAGHARLTTIQDKGYWHFWTVLELMIVAYRCSKLIACLVVENIQSWFVSSAKPLWPRTKVKVTDTSMSMYAMHKSTVMPNVNAIA